MNGRIVITLDDGRTMTGSLSFDDPKTAVPVTEEPVKSVPASNVARLDYSIPLRPFMNENSDRLSGSKKFTLLVSHFVKGEVDVQVDRAEVIDAWNKMTGLLGGKFNGAHEARAKDSGWVYVPEAGKVALLKNWTRIFS